MLVVDFPDNRLQQVLEGHKAVHAPELVDHQTHVDPRHPHPQQKIGAQHRCGDIQRVPAQAMQDRFLPGDRGRRGRRILGRREQEDDVLDVDDAHGVIEGFPIDRHPGQFAPGEAPHHLVERQRDLQGDDIGPGGHHIPDPQGLERLRLIYEIDGLLFRGRRLRAGVRLPAVSKPSHPRRGGGAGSGV